MAQIVVFGRVMHELVPKEGQSKQQYVCFDLMERSGNNPPDYYQVWARGDDVTRLMRLKVKKGSMIWLTGSQKLVDVRQKDGTTDPDDAAPVPSPPEVMNGDREPLPE